jgi:transcriptional regulator with XRE-family HTH domain
LTAPIRPAWAALTEAYGGVLALAAALGVTRQTIWNWSRGARVPGPSAIAVAQLARKKHLASPVKP